MWAVLQTVHFLHGQKAETLIEWSLGFVEKEKMIRVKSLACLLVAAVCVLPAFAAVDDDMHGHHHDANEKLGTISFPISCAADSQKSFERGVALLHSFGYEEAEEQFTEVAKKDPGCAMAHWGIAMSLFHQIWERPEDTTLKRGHDEIETAQKIGAKTDRERAYISALGAFYSDPSKDHYLRQAKAYSDAMAKVYQQNPEDLEAGAFYALSLLASESPDDVSHTASKKAVATLNPLFQKQPDHPGLAHYIIHACDSPDMASLGLDAARRYAAIAPSSAHAVHMPSHIFARLGLWDEDIQANLKSVALTEQSGAMYMRGHELHAMHFLLYAYLQTGHDESAKEIVGKAKKIVAGATTMDDTGMLEYMGFAAAHFPALYNLEMHHWADAAALKPLANTPPYLQRITYWARTIGSAHLGDVEATRRNAREFDEAEEATRKSKYAYTLEGKRSSYAHDEVHAWLAFVEKKNDEAVRQMRQVADSQDQGGKAEVDIPAREMLAEMLLDMKQPERALAEYEKSMKIDPNRFNGLAGAAQAAALAHQAAKANTYYGQMLKNCDGGKFSERPELQSAKTEVAKNAE
jgi:tetratricopeptide (TPR) repeat protein